MKTSGIGISALESRLLRIVAKYYYGVGDITKLVPAEKLCLSSVWRREVQEEARQVACWLLQRHSSRGLDELQKCAAVMKLQISETGLRLRVEQARRKIADGDYSIRLAVENVERMLFSVIAVNIRKENTYENKRVH